jgi:hypothetical protein
MKLKHLIAWTVYFALLASLVMLFGCANPELTRKITAWQKAYPDREGDCLIVAWKREAYYQRIGVPVRLCRGKYQGEGHAWVEYYDGEWLVDDRAIWYINKGYPRNAYKTGGKDDYELGYWIEIIDGIPIFGND